MRNANGPTGLPHATAANTGLSDDTLRVSGRKRGMIRLLTPILSVVALTGFSALIWFSYAEGIRAGESGAIPLIKAEAGPAKIRPKDPGGLKPKHQDKYVYDRIAPGQSGKKVERLAPKPEKPLTPKKVEPAAGGNNSGASGGAATAGKAGSKASGKASAKAGVKPVEKSGEKTPKQLAQAKNADGTITEKERALSLKAIGPYRVQVASVRSYGAAASLWKRLNSKHNDLLGRLAYFVEKVDLGKKKGVYYRVQGGPLTSEKAAKSLCSQLRKRSVSCLIVKA